MTLQVPLRVVFLGTSDFAVPTLKALASHSELCDLKAVFTQPDRPSGRGQKLLQPSVKVTAQKLNLPLYQPENINNQESKQILSSFSPHVIVVVSFGQFLDKELLKIPTYGCINVHASLLPKYRGAAPIQYAIWKGEKETGVTTMRLISKMDAGPILLQKTISLTSTTRAAELHNELSLMGSQLLIETLQKLAQGTLNEHEQEESKASIAPAITKKQGIIHWEAPGEEILRQIRALHPWPGTFSHSSHGILKIHEAQFLSSPIKNAKSGTVLVDTGSFLVKCKDGWMDLKIVQLEGKKIMKAHEFLNGLRKKEELFFND